MSGSWTGHGPWQQLRQGHHHGLMWHASLGFLSESLSECFHFPRPYRAILMCFLLIWYTWSFHEMCIQNVVFKEYLNICSQGYSMDTFSIRQWIFAELAAPSTFKVLCRHDWLETHYIAQGWLARKSFDITGGSRSTGLRYHIWPMKFVLEVMSWKVLLLIKIKSVYSKGLRGSSQYK